VLANEAARQGFIGREKAERDIFAKEKVANCGK
jgi:hypothetical protein